MKMKDTYGLTRVKTLNLENLTSEELEIYNAKVEKAEKLAKKPTPRAVTKISLPRAFTMFKQQNDTYCAPACGQSVIYYIKGKKLTQKEIAKGMQTLPTGTIPTFVAPYLTSQTIFPYVRTESPKQGTMCNYLYSTIAGNKKPALMSIKTTEKNWYYDVEGHRVVIKAIYSDKSKIEFADPLGGFENNGVPASYIKSTSKAHDVCRDIIW